jgi:hypothetical protein
MTNLEILKVLEDNNIAFDLYIKVYSMMQEALKLKAMAREIRKQYGPWTFAETTLNELIGKICNDLAAYNDIIEKTMEPDGLYESIYDSKSREISASIYNNYKDRGDYLAKQNLYLLSEYVGRKHN